LAEHPRNWRTHPDTQRAALADIIADVGWSGACLYNERTGHLLDGHLRRNLGTAQGTDKIPVLIGNWSKEQELRILATLDPIRALAQVDSAKLASLLHDVSTGSEALEQLLAELAVDAVTGPAPVGPAIDPGPQIDRAAELQDNWGTAPGQLWLIPSKSAPPRKVVRCPHCDHEQEVACSARATDAARGFRPSRRRKRQRIVCSWAMPRSRQMWPR
jgi:hypothetical protein